MNVVQCMQCSDRQCKFWNHYHHWSHCIVRQEVPNLLADVMVTRLHLIIIIFISSPMYI